MRESSSLLRVSEKDILVRASTSLVFFYSISYTHPNPPPLINVPWWHSAGKTPLSRSFINNSARGSSSQPPDSLRKHQLCLLARTTFPCPAEPLSLFPPPLSLYFSSQKLFLQMRIIANLRRSQCPRQVTT